MNNIDVSLPKNILRRKFRVPSLASSYTPSKKAKELVKRPLDWRICLVTSPTGYGKTAFLSYWYAKLQEHQGIVPMWISLDETDKDVSLFIIGIAYVLCAEHQEFREFVEGCEQQENSSQEKSLLIELCNYIDQYCNPETTYVIFLDNYEAAASQAFDDAITFLNNNTDSNIKIVISGSFRSQRFDDLLFTSSICEINQRDFEMDEKELSSFATTLLPQLDGTQMSKMKRDYGNWPLPYLFAALCLSRTQDEENIIQEVESYLNRHFTTSVMDHVDADTYEFLVETSILESMTPDLCDTVCKRNNSRVILQYLCSHGMYCRYDNIKREYVYEPAFRKFLLQKLLSFKPELINSLVSEATIWHAQHDENIRYAKYVAIMNDPFYLSNVTESCVGEELGDPETLTERFLLTPSDEFAKNNALIWAVVWSFIAIGEVKQAEKWMERITDADAAQANTSLRYVRAIGYALEGDSDKSRRAIREIFDTEGNKLSRDLQCLLIHMEGEDCERLGNPKNGRELYKKALSLSKRTGTFYRLFDFYLLSHQHFLLGDFEEAKKYAELGISECTINMPLMGEFNAILASCLIERGSLDDASVFVKRALRKAAPQANADMFLDANMCVARYQRALGNTPEALQILTDALRNVRTIRVPRNLEISAHTLRLSLAIDLGETSAMRESEQVIDEFDADTDVLRSAPAMLAKARLLLFEGNTKEAFAVVERSKQLCHLAGSRYFNTLLYITESSCYAACGQHERALSLMIQAVELASRGGYVMVFAEGGARVGDSLMHIAAKQKLSSAIRTHAKKVISTLNIAKQESYSEPIRAASNADNALTQRETEVLRLLNQGMTRYEIADYLSLSQNTVKSHLKNIYSKLGAHSREDAFRIYQQMESEK